jgi:hypothetical protein
MAPLKLGFVSGLPRPQSLSLNSRDCRHVPLATLRRSYPNSLAACREAMSTLWHNAADAHALRVGIGGTADMNGRVASANSVEFDPTETLAAKFCCDAQRGISYSGVLGSNPRAERST